MIKSIFFLFITFFNLLPITCRTQDLEAKYKVSRVIFNTDINGNRKKIATLQYDGFLYQKKNRTIYYQKPLYLNDYPKGNVDIVVNAHYTMLITLPMDTLQHIYYMDFDSLNTISRVELSGLNSKEWNIKQHLSKGSMRWQLLPDTKEINGLKCQKATFTAPGAGLQWEVWFCPNINALAGPFTIRDLPGLVVEAYSPVFDETYILENYNTNISLSDGTFWPDVFNESK